MYYGPGDFTRGFVGGLSATTNMINSARNANLREKAFNQQQEYQQRQEARQARMDKMSEQKFNEWLKNNQRQAELLDRQLKQQDLTTLARSFQSSFTDPNTGKLRQINLNDPKDAAIYQIFMKNAANKIPSLKQWGAMHPSVNPNEPYVGVVANPNGTVTPALQTKQGDVVPMTQNRTSDDKDVVLQTDPNDLLFIVSKELQPYMTENAALRGKDRYIRAGDNVFDTATRQWIRGPGDKGEGLGLGKLTSIYKNLPAGTELSPGSPLAVGLRGAGIQLEPVKPPPVNAGVNPPELAPDAVGVVEPGVKGYKIPDTSVDQGLINYYMKEIGDPVVAKQIAAGQLKPELVPPAGLTGNNQFVLKDRTGKPIVAYEQDRKTGQWIRKDVSGLGGMVAPGGGRGIGGGIGGVGGRGAAIAPASETSGKLPAWFLNKGQEFGNP